MILQPPKITLETLKEEVIPGSEYLTLLRKTVRVHYPGGRKSKSIVLDHIERERMDAVVILGHFLDFSLEYPERYIYLRSAIRSSLMFRNYLGSGVLEDENIGNLFEIPAGLIESKEIGVEGILQAAVREFYEEVGFKVGTSQLKPLGPRVFSCPGVLAERLFYYEVEVEPKLKKEPILDGSPLEEGGIVQALPLRQALSLIDRGYFPDAKTEIGLRRLANRYQ